MLPSAERTRLIAEVLAFVRSAQRLPGIMRIALIGSLTTDKVSPEDADLLVTVADDMDLTPLASMSRKMLGHAQSMNRGVDVFLADPQNKYLGRVCLWKECAPGIRIRCDALHCGRRHYLHDDLQDIKLAHSVIAAPPLELWPEVVARVPIIPQDVEQRLLIPMKGEKP